MAGKIKSPSHDLLETLSIVRSERDQLDDIDDPEQNMDDDKDDTDSDDDDSDDDSDDDDKKGKSPNNDIPNCIMIYFNKRCAL